MLEKVLDSRLGLSSGHSSLETHFSGPSQWQHFPDRLTLLSGWQWGSRWNQGGSPGNVLLPGSSRRVEGAGWSREGKKVSLEAAHAHTVGSEVITAFLGSVKIE